MLSNSDNQPVNTSFNVGWTGFYLADNENPNSIKSNTVCNPSFIYLGLVLRGFPPLISSPQASTLGAAHNKVTSYQS